MADLPTASAPVVNAVSAEVSKAKAEPQRLDQKLFFWDNIIFYVASAILGLSVSNIVVDFLRPEPNTVTCFTPFNYTINQANYVNNFCNDFLPFSENFSLALVAHGVLLLAPQYLWKAYFSARIDFFFFHAAKLETLRERDTGEYPHTNFSVVDYMHREFYERRDILIGYIIKLSLQCVVAVIALIISNVLFQDFDIQFDCFYQETATQPDSILTRCSYSKLRFVSILRWFDYVLLVLSILTILYGLWWCLLRSHPELGHKDISLFCYDSCTNSKHYKAKKWYRLKNDLHFLLVSLFATNAGLGRVFKSVQIANDISHELSGHLESLDNFDSMKHPQRENDMKENSGNIFKDNKSFAKVMFEICKGIHEEQEEQGLNVTIMGAMDIGCGYHSYLFAIARWQKQVISIILDPYYKNQTKIYKSDEHHAGVKIMRIPTNLFGLPKKHKSAFSNEIQVYSGMGEPSDVETVIIKIALVVVGPLDSDRKVKTVLFTNMFGL
ncbi:uncharacterized protein [Dysidea avara]|uniref:uncharacterized protein isoform X2 n=1 Tax=Dysidea avara TaxID=196820 RepID=UPI0033175A45